MKILIVENDLSQDDIDVLKQNINAFLDKQNVILVDVIPKIPPQYYQLPETEELEKTLSYKAQSILSQHGEQLGIVDSNQVIIEGAMKEEIYALAEQQKVDVIVAHDPKELKLHSFFDRWLNHASYEIPVVNPHELKQTLVH